MMAKEENIKFRTVRKCVGPSMVWNLSCHTCVNSVSHQKNFFSKLQQQTINVILSQNPAYVVITVAIPTINQ